MPTVTNKALESSYGFKSTGFAVDSLGNITARTLVQTGAAALDPETPANHTITENAGNTAYLWSPSASENPAITLSRASTYILDLTSLTNGIYFYNGATQYHVGLTHSDGSSGIAALGKTSGRLVWAIAGTAPDTLTYRNLSGTISGTISITNPVGQFTTVLVNSTNVSTASTNGALIVSGGAGIALNSNFGADVGIAGNAGIAGTLTVPNIYNNGTLSLDGTSIVLKIAGTTVGTLTSTGMAGMAINNSSINNSVIGGTTPASASFTSVTIANSPTTNTSGANKKYVDDTATALSIALGI